MDDREATLIYLENEVLLSKTLYDGWKDCQDDYDGYKTSMNPMNKDELLSFFSQDWGEDDTMWPFTREDISDFYQNDAISLSSKGMSF